MRKRILTVLLATLLCFGVAACKKPDYSAYAGAYTLVSVTGEGTDAPTYADFAYGTLTLTSGGDYTFDYKYKETVGRMTGTFAPNAEGNVLHFYGNISGDASYSTGYFVLSFAFGDMEIETVYTII